MGSEVTVLIPAYNAGGYLAKAVESVFRQTYREWRLVLVDDASTDSSLSSIREYTFDPRVTLLKNSRNRGQSHSLNRGLEWVNTPFTVQLDADDLFLPHTLETLVDRAGDLPSRTAVLGGNIRIVYEDCEGRVLGSAVCRNRSFQEPYDFLLANNSVWPRFFRTKALIKVGGWPVNDPFEGRYMEDRILFKLIENHDFHWIDRILYIHRRHGRNLTNDIALYNRAIEWAVRDALKRWGGACEPVFTEEDGNLKKVIRLIPGNPD